MGIPIPTADLLFVGRSAANPPAAVAAADRRAVCFDCLSVCARGVVSGDAGGRRPPLFRQAGDASPNPRHFFGLKFVQKLVHCCNWLFTETQCKIISVQHVCRPKLFKNLCLRLVSGVPSTSF